MFSTGNTASSNLTKCSCQPPCETVHYDAYVTNSHLSDVLINSLMTGDAGNNIRERYLRANEVRTRVDYSELKASQVIKMLKELLASLKYLKAVISVDLLKESTSSFRQLLSAVGVIYQKTADSLNLFNQKVQDIVMSMNGCWPNYITRLKQVLLRVLLMPLDYVYLHHLFPMKFQSILDVKLAFYSLYSRYWSFCDFSDKYKRWIAPTRLDGFREEDDFFSEPDKLIKIAKQLIENSKELESIKSYFDKTDPVHLHQWLTGETFALQPNVSSADMGTLFQLRLILQKGIKNFSELFQSLFTQEIQKCDSQMQKWKNDANSLQEIIFLNNKFSHLSWNKTGDELIAVFDVNIQWLDDIISLFELGKITSVSAKIIVL